MTQMTLGGRIKYHRKRLNMTQEQLAERMGVSAQAVSKWENDLSCPDISVLPELAAVFGITVDALLGREAETVHEAEVVDEKPEKDGHSIEIKWSSKFGSILFALYILSVGGLLLMNNLCGFDVSFWRVLWTTALVYIGVSGLIGGFSLFCTVMSLAGVYFLLSAYGVLQFELGWGIVLPVLLLLWGIGLLIDVFFGKIKWGKRWSNRGKTTVHVNDNRKLQCSHSCEDGILTCDMSFGEQKIVVETPLLRGGSIDTSFGAFTVDFSGVEAIAPDCCVEVDNSFGRLVLLVPQKFAVQVRDSDSFAAAIDWKGSPSEHPIGTLGIKSDNSFGNLSVQYI